MEPLLFGVLVLVGLFAVGTVLGATYVPTRAQTTKAALKLLHLKAGDTLLDLGSGGGGVLIAAAERGIRGVGYEINPLLYIISRVRTKKYGDLVDIKLADFWHQDWPPAQGVYVFLTSRFMGRLDQKIKEEFAGPVKVVSYAYQIPGRKPIKKELGLLLYYYS